LCELGYDRFQAVEQSLLPLKQSPPRPPREGLDAEWTFPEGASGLFGAELPDAWKSRREILSLYRYIRLGYFLLGDDGILNGLDFYQADDLRDWVAEFLGKRTRQCVPGWYDTHARHAGAAVSSLAGEAFAWRFPRDFPENDSSADEGESGAERLLPYRAGNRVAA